ncbi:hypothetical protein Poli38472_009652 [Pythium oligandrum]|uniref:non-specific serine/threonine protein kinase n=1 Tax=Pythium oligandrum TaxID=41045 RepID=A0A8K1FIK0_PYTOL|nr:hypothetical protein Poli38472_009652 [Pythium oligandrum]|eukprot:TMW62159.1 hypothetical protein Poli38472_009652 [Pythium oligandrum]
MGNSPLTREFSTRRFSMEEREAMKKFCEEEIHLLRETFKGLANVKNGAAVDKETFLKCFPLPGLLGERLFEVIDKDGSGSIGYNEFVYGLAILFRGTRKEKLKFIFDLYDLSDTGSISRYELVTMLHQFPASTLEHLNLTEEPDTSTSEPSTKNINDEIEALVDLAFPTGHAHARLTFQQFTEWCDRTPGIANLLISVLPSEDGNAAPITPIDCSKSGLQGGDDTMRRRSSLKTLSPTRSYGRLITQGPVNQKELEKTRQLLLEAKQTCPVDALTGKILSLIGDVESALRAVVGASTTPHSSSSPSICLGPGSGVCASILQRGSIKLDGLDIKMITEQEFVSGDLWKRGSRLRQMIKRHYVLQGNFLYYYANKDDTAPRGVTFMCGCYVESLPQNAVVEKNIKYYAIDIVPEPTSSREKRTIYCKSLEEQAKWTKALRNATDKVSIEAFYVIGRQLGTGRFSRVCEATHKHTGATHAVKIIDKGKLSATERELLRTEIAILKLVTHPNIIRLHEIYEDKQNIYIVTELVSGGDLYSRIDGHNKYTESQARTVMLPLLESIAYIHRLGIVHRDIKPENVLCGDQGDLKIADFGLSKLVHPEEIMKMPCGTLNYVAPEVLAMLGYGKEADIWSVGVIMYLLVRGVLPFQSKTKNEIIQKTLHAEINLESDPVLSNVSPACKSLLKGLLTKDPSKRLTAQDALKHDWFTQRLVRGDSITGEMLANMHKTPRNSVTTLATTPTTIM